MAKPDSACRQLRILDLFCGLGGATQALRDRGHYVLGVDNELSLRPDIVADVRFLPLARPKADQRWDLIWASPPCTEFSREFMPWSRTGQTPSLELVCAAVNAIRRLRPRFWLLENTQGSIRYISRVLGKWHYHLGSAFIWGTLPGVRKARVAPHKERLGSRDSAKRSLIPYEISVAIADALERLG